MPANTKTITIGPLAAASANNIATSQSGATININGAAASGGVATLDIPRRVGIASAGNDTSITFQIVGTDRYGRAQSEVLVGAGTATAQSLKDYLTIKSVKPSGAVATSVTVGTTGTASSDAYITDWLPNGNLLGINCILSGSAVTYSVEECYDDFAPAWDQAANTFSWVQDSTIKSTSVAAHGTLAGPFTAVRITVNSYTGTTSVVTAKLITPFIGGAI